MRQMRWRRGEIAGECENSGIIRMKKRLAVRFAEHFDLGDRLALESLHDHEIDRRETREMLRERRLRRAPQVAHQREALRRCYEHLMRARLAMLVRILARRIDVEGVMRMLDRRNADAAA